MNAEVFPLAYLGQWDVCVMPSGRKGVVVGLNPDRDVTVWIDGLGEADFSPALMVRRPALFVAKIPPAVVVH